MQNTIIEPAWCGHLTLELSNHGHTPIDIEAGSPIAQIIFHQLLEPTEIPYAGKYNQQPDRPVAAVMEGMNND